MVLFFVFADPVPIRFHYTEQQREHFSKHLFLYFTEEKKVFKQHESE